MRRFLYTGGLLFFIGTMASPISAADKRQAYNRPSVSIEPAIFKLSYGKIGKLCATVTPARKASLFTTPSAWQNAADAPDVFEITPGADPSCSGPGKVFLSVKSKLTQCTAQGKVRAMVKNRNSFFEAGVAVGNVLLPDKTVSTFLFAGICDSNVTYNVRFDNSQDTTEDFNGLAVSETWTLVPPNSCQMGGRQDSWTVGTYSSGDPAPLNSIDDGNGQCPLPNNCVSVVQQTFTIGACTFPQTPISITVQNQNGVSSVTRSDCVGAHCVGGQ